MGCELHARDGHHQAIRDTWGKDLEGFADLRFFVGRGEQELADDEVRLDVPDNKETLLYKVAEICRWAVEGGYGSIFKVNTNTYVNVPEVVAHQHYKFDWAGSVVGKLGDPYAGTAAYGFIQGSASWLSRKAAKLVYAENGAVAFAFRHMPEWMKYNGLIAPYLHSEDLWISQVLTPHLGDLAVLVDSGYGNGPLSFWSQSNYIKHYALAEWMSSLHAARPNIERMRQITEDLRRRG